MMTIPEGFKPQLAIEQTKVKTQPDIFEQTYSFWSTT
jgi:hypothetical protein